MLSTPQYLLCRTVRPSASMLCRMAFVLVCAAAAEHAEWAEQLEAIDPNQAVPVRSAVQYLNHASSSDQVKKVVGPVRTFLAVRGMACITPEQLNQEKILLEPFQQLKDSLQVMFEPKGGYLPPSLKLTSPILCWASRPRPGRSYNPQVPQLSYCTF